MCICFPQSCVKVPIRLGHAKGCKPFLLKPPPSVHVFNCYFVRAGPNPLELHSLAQQHPEDALAGIRAFLAVPSFKQGTLSLAVRREVGRAVLWDIKADWCIADF